MKFLLLSSLLTRLTALAFASFVLYTTAVFGQFTPPDDGQAPAGPLITAGGRYTPPSDAKAPQDVTSAGRRGESCDDSSDIGLIALAPYQYVGQSLSTQPTLTWFVPDTTPYKLHLSVYQYDGNIWTNIVEELEIGYSQRGYMSYSVPASFGLEIDNLYEWQIELICQEGRPSANNITKAQFEIVNRPANLGSVGGDRVQQAQQYANVGLWYDAMSLLSGTSLTPAERTYRSELLSSLAEFEDAPVATQLRLIAEID